MEYNPPWIFKFAHINTCFPTFFRKIKIKFTRERINTPDGDFLDLDWYKNSNDKILILCHGLEGSSNSQYIHATAKYFGEKGWDTLAMNYRGCSGEMNKKPCLYHSGFTSDLELLIEKVKSYKKLAIVGYSLGGNLVLKYLGERNIYPDNLLCGMAVSAPCDLYANSLALKAPRNFIYRLFFVNKLRKKGIAKAKLYPFLFDENTITKLKYIDEFDTLITAPTFGFNDSTDYYKKMSSINFISNINIDTFILTPQDDPIMAPECYPYEEAKNNPHILLETPKYGGHVGFSQIKDYPYYLEQRLYEYVKSIEDKKRK